MEAIVAQAKEIKPGQARNLNARCKALSGPNPAQAAAELAALMRRYGLKVWNERTLAQLDHLACSSLYLAHHRIEGIFWQGPSEHKPQEQCRFARQEEVIALHTPNYKLGLVVHIRTHTPAPGTTSRVHPTNIGWYAAVHAHRLPLSLPIAWQTWHTCCKRPEELDKSLYPELVQSIEAGEAPAKIASHLERIWQDVHGRATLVSLT